MILQHNLLPLQLGQKFLVLANDVFILYLIKNEAGIIAVKRNIHVLTLS